MDRPVKDGVSLRESFRLVREQTGHPDPREDWPHKKPAGGTYLVSWFFEISMGRQVSQAGLLPIAPREINEWCTLRRVRLKDWEIDTILALDRKYREVMVEDG